MRKFDEDILRDLGGREGATNEEIAEEICITGHLKGDINEIIASLAELLKQNPSSLQQKHLQRASTSEGTPAMNQNNLHVRFPKLEVKCFKDKIEECKNSGSVVESSIYLNTALSNGVKFLYLCRFVEIMPQITVPFSEKKFVYLHCIDFRDRRPCSWMISNVLRLHWF